MSYPNSKVTLSPDVVDVGRGSASLPAVHLPPATAIYQGPVSLSSQADDARKSRPLAPATPMMVGQGDGAWRA